MLLKDIETNLKKQFELLKSAYLIDDEIKIDLHSDKLKKAKKFFKQTYKIFRLFR